jgi:hypothetical protein
MKKLALAGIALFLFSCGTTVVKSSVRPLYEVLTQQEDGGGNIRFYEILTESNEIKMLEHDDKLKNKIKADDINKSNFVILNMGEKNTAGYSISVKSAEETADKVILTLQDIEPKGGGNALSEPVYPYTIVKVNSKKEIVIK